MPRAALAAAKTAVLDALVFDIETTEDAAHQLAFFHGIHALDTLMQLASAVALVSAEDLHRVANRFLQPRQRNIAWYLPFQSGDISPDKFAPKSGSQITELRRTVRPDESPVSTPLHRRLNKGLPVIVQASDLSNTVQLQLIVPGTHLDGDNLLTNEPVDGYSAIEWQMRPDELPKVIAGLRESLDALRPIAKGVPSTDPATRLEEEFARNMNFNAAASGGDAATGPALVLVSGAVQQEQTIRQLAAELGDSPIAAIPKKLNNDFQADDEVVHLGRTIRQAQLGYIVPAAAPADAAHDAWRLLLYILSHDYEGRLGKAAISDRGLAYYIDSRYRSNGEEAWVTLSVGVDTGKIEELDTLLRAELDRLTTQQPTLAEIEEAKSYYLGRARSAAQSNAELNDSLARDWLWYGEILSPAALGKRLAAVSREDVLAIIPAFTAGKTILVRD
jgi:predicted Zn-dependent peptidase